MGQGGLWDGGSILMSMIALFDNFFFTFLHGLSGQSVFVDALIVFVASFLPFLFCVGVIGYAGLCVYQRTRRFPRRHTLSDFEGALLVAGLFAASIAHTIASSVQEIVARPRPYVVLGVSHLFSVGTWSFPSGHAAALFALAAALRPFHRSLGAVAYLVAFLVALARVASGVHYPTDIIAGAILGVIVGSISARLVLWLVRYERKMVRERVLSTKQRM